MEQVKDRQKFLTIHKIRRNLPSNRHLLLGFITILGLYVLFYPGPTRIEVEPPHLRSWKNREDRAQCPDLQFGDIKNLDPYSEKVLDYVRCNHLFAPSEKPYVFVASEPSDALKEIREIFQNKKHGFFVECGANDGQYLSNTLQLETESQWTGLLIEADPVLSKRMLGKHRKAWIADVCASPYNRVSEMEFIHHEAVMGEKADWKQGIASLRMNDGSDIGSDSKAKKYTLKPAGMVKCFPIPALLAAMNVKHVDFMSLDVEGVEYKILNTFPFDDQLRIDFIQVEHKVIPEGKDALKSLLESKGYRVRVETEIDFIFEYIAEQGGTKD